MMVNLLRLLFTMLALINRVMLILMSSSKYLGMDMVDSQLLYSVNRTLMSSSSTQSSVISSRIGLKFFLC